MTDTLPYVSDRWKAQFEELTDTLGRICRDADAREGALHDALERARHALVTYQGLVVYDDGEPAQAGDAIRIDDTKLIALIDSLLGPPTGQVMGPL